MSTIDIKKVTIYDFAKAIGDICRATGLLQQQPLTGTASPSEDVTDRQGTSLSLLHSSDASSNEPESPPLDVNKEQWPNHDCEFELKGDGLFDENNNPHFGWGLSLYCTSTSNTGPVRKEGGKIKKFPHILALMDMKPIDSPQANFTLRTVPHRFVYQKKKFVLRSLILHGHDHYWNLFLWGNRWVRHDGCGHGKFEVFRLGDFDKIEGGIEEINSLFYECMDENVEEPTPPQVWERVQCVGDPEFDDTDCSDCKEMEEAEEAEEAEDDSIAKAAFSLTKINGGSARKTSVERDRESIKRVLSWDDDDDISYTEEEKEQMKRDKLEALELRKTIAESEHDIFDWLSGLKNSPIYSPEDTPNDRPSPQASPQASPRQAVSPPPSPEKVATRRSKRQRKAPEQYSP